MNKFPSKEDILKSPVAGLNQHLAVKEANNKRKVIKARNDCPEVVKIHWDLKYWCLEKGFQFQKEYRFLKNRKFRFDFAIPDRMIAIEYDGLMSKKSGHTTLTGFTKDTVKLNLAIQEGWEVLRYTVLTYQNVLQDLEKLING